MSIQLKMLPLVHNILISVHLRPSLPRRAQQDKLERGPKHSTFKQRDARSNAQRGFECDAKQSIVHQKNAPNPCRPSYRRETIIDHRLLVSAYRHGGDAGPPVRFNQLTTVRFNLQSH